jgi:hypothetical protein
LLIGDEAVVGQDDVRVCTERGNQEREAKASRDIDTSNQVSLTARIDRSKLRKESGTGVKKSILVSS